MFETYLRLGSVAELAAELNRQGLKPKPRTLSDGRVIAPAFYRVGPLAYLLKNRFYIGEVVYRDEINKGEHPPILDRELFEKVQAKLTEGAVQRSDARVDASAILTGLIFDDRQNPMTPSHANKKGVRYRYYVSHALLQNQKDAAGSIARVTAPDVETLVLKAVADQMEDAERPGDRELVEAHVARVTVHVDRLHIQTRDIPNTELLTVPFTPRGVRLRGVAHQSTDPGLLDAETRHTLLHAIARARNWMDQLVSGKTASIDDIATAENLAERHVRFLLPLAYLSPLIICAIASGTAPGGLTVSGLARALPHKWPEQEQLLRAG